MLTDLHRQAPTAETHAGFIQISTLLVTVETHAVEPLFHPSPYLWNEDTGE